MRAKSSGFGSAVPSPASTTWWRKSTPSCSATIVPVVPLCGLRRPIRSCRKSPDFVHEFPGHNTRSRKSSFAFSCTELVQLSQAHVLVKGERFEWFGRYAREHSGDNVAKLKLSAD